jgi:chain length determinant protein (polysaccharide antigen chain regulator)
MFLLGSEALKSMIDNEASRPTGLFSCILSDQAKLLDIQNLNVNPTQSTSIVTS